ncbi:MAG: acetate--CoA ligase [Thermomicrobiales bacterium]
MSSADQPAFAPLLQSDQLVPPPAALAEVALVPDHDTLYARAATDSEGFWAEVARELEWETPPGRTLDWDGVTARWFVGGRCNITVNCLDRHLHGAKRDKAALIFIGEDGAERRFSYAELHRLVCKFASGLKELGIGKGDRVCIYMPLTPEGMAAMLACARIGAIHSVTYAGIGAGALRTRIADAGARAVITADVGYRRGKTVALKPIVDEAIDGLAHVERVIVWRREKDSPKVRGPREVDLHELLTGASPRCEATIVDAEDPLFILYTSGTTGRPKGPMYVHGGYQVGVSFYTRIAYDLKDDDVYWCTSDIGWIVGHSSMLYGPLMNGVTIVVREGAPDFPDPGVCWRIIEQQQVTVMFTAPTTLRMFMKFGSEYPAAADLSTLRLLICAGEPLNPEAWWWAYKHLLGEGRGHLCDNWWQTETGAPTIGTLPSMAAKPGWAGKPLPGYRAEVVDREGNPAPPNTGGLLVLRGPWPQMMRTLWNDPARYEEYWRTIDGCYFAGDVAVRGEDGYFMILGRADDVLNVAGHRIGTADVESALVSHPAVAEAGVIGKPDPIKGEAIKAFVTLRAGQQATDDLIPALVAHVRHELGPIATPSEIAIVDRLPKTRSGKIMRRVLKAQELGLDPGDLTTIEE